MKTTTRSGWGIAALVLALAATGAEAKVIGGATLPDQTTVAGKLLMLNGAAVQKVLVFKVYAVGLYLEEKTRDAEHAIESDQAKRIQLHALRTAPRKQVASALRNGMRTSGADMEALGPRIQQLEQSLEDVKAGQTLTITYVPGVGTELTGGDKKVVIEGKDFADALFSTWLGDDPGVKNVKKGLLGLE